MAQAQRKAFRIEASMNGQTVGTASGGQALSTGQDASPSLAGGDAATILHAIAELKSMIEPSEELDQAKIDSFHKEMAEVKRLEAEMSAIRAAIQQTKTEIATLHQSGFQGKELGKVTDELDAVVQGTEQATEAILGAAETIEDRVGNLSAKLDGDDQGMANDAAESVMTIFEACNFQDITGQRITKVVRTMRFIEERIDSMMEIWGGMESFEEVATLDVGPKGDAALLNGPAMEEDTNVASQDDIDALFD
jgi:chemotaxis protein CheZ